eukprot:6240312-Amphidinium_carterae.1
MIQPAADIQQDEPTRKYNFHSMVACRLLTSFGLDLLAGILSGPQVDRATLQLVGVLFASILVPGLARALVAHQQKNWQ